MNLLEIIEKIQKEKEAKRIDPDHARYLEIIKITGKPVKDEINNLVKEGKLEWGQTINDNWFKIKK